MEKVTEELLGISVSTTPVLLNIIRLNRDNVLFIVARVSQVIALLGLAPSGNVNNSSSVSPDAE